VYVAISEGVVIGMERLDPRLRVSFDDIPLHSTSRFRLDKSAFSAGICLLHILCYDVLRNCSLDHCDRVSGGTMFASLGGDHSASNSIPSLANPNRIVALVDLDCFYAQGVRNLSSFAKLLVFVLALMLKRARFINRVPVVYCCCLPQFAL